MWNTFNFYLKHFIFQIETKCLLNLKFTVLHFFQIARELRLRDIGGIIVVDFIDMADECK